ncbi:MAG TPA: DinB family protein [Anaerolineales bacterium]|nr:DinB family protein [Anaerolineales bacterium]
MTPITLLIDLDDTLLLNSSSHVFPAYLEALSKHLSFLGDPETILKILFQATVQMEANLDPRTTLKQVFDKHFYPHFGIAAQDIESELVDFYTNTYPTLAPLSQPNPAAVELVQKSFERGDTVAIATSPYFPLIAVEERLRWAQLSPDEYPFALISSYESFHFIKPHQAYYAEILAQLGWPETPVVMIGNDLEMDTYPASAFGLATYHVENSPFSISGENAARGPLTDCYDWLHSQPKEALMPHFSDTHNYLEIMRAVPAALQTLLRDIPPAQWHEHTAQDEWSITEIICHLRDVDNEIHTPRFELVRDDPNPFIQAVDADAWADERNYQQQNGPQALIDFLESRTALLELIQSLDEDFQKKIIQHTIFGPTSLFELIKIASRHDRLHIQQLYAQLPGK